MSSVKGKKEGHNDYWRSLNQLEDTPEFRKWLEEEFPGGLEAAESFSRRGFMKVMAASMAIMGLTGCRRPEEKIVPYLSNPEEVIYGQPNTYATTMPFGLSNYGLLATSVEGRPIKLDGNPLHPSTLGGSNSFIQAAIMGLYDADRSDSVMDKGVLSSWVKFVEFWRTHSPELLQNRGAGLVVISEPFASPTLARLKDEFLKRYPEAVWVAYEPVSDENIYKGIALGIGQAYRPVYRYEKADVVFSLDCDFLHQESDNVSAAAKFIEGRRIASENDSMNRLYMIESVFSLTGAMADHRMRLQSQQVAAFAGALAYELESMAVDIVGKPALEQYARHNFNRDWIQSLARELYQNRGSGLLVTGCRQPPLVHALVLALNEALGNIGKTVDYFELHDTCLPDQKAVEDVVGSMHKGGVDTLIVFGGNPVYDMPVDLDFKSALDQVSTSIHFSHYLDETSHHCTWHVNRSHFLESWGDARLADGTLSVIQPLINPLLKGHADVEFLNVLATGQDQSGELIVQETWQGLINAEFDKKWRRVLYDGLDRESASLPASIRINKTAIESEMKRNPVLMDEVGGDDLEVVFVPDASVYDGRYTNNGWLLELPDPVTKFSWDNAACLSPGTADRFKLKNGEIVNLKLHGNQIEIPVWIVPGFADDSIALPLGYGRVACGDIGNGVGVDVYPLRSVSDLHFTHGLTLSKTGKHRVLANTQDHHSMEGRPLIREASLNEYRENPLFAAEAVEVPPLESLWDDHAYTDPHQWGMVIDLNTCIGCGACTIACQIENNVPLVGRKQVTNGREMHWIRVDRYYKGDINDPEMIFQPVPCMQCELAPCEQVCPVQATSHDEEGLNVMVYNRCLGTRYCSNNCPYKVRRFNFFNYTNRYNLMTKMAQNPDVTVRSRGVMEKCSYCLQRINRAKHNARLENRELKDGDIITACQQACPTGSIYFGNLKDAQAEVVAAKSQNRNYEILAEFNTRPRTSFLAKVRNRKA